MRRIGTVIAIIAVVLLTRCGEADRPLLLPTRTPTPELIASTPPALVPSLVQPDVAFVPEAKPLRQPTRLEIVRELVRELGTPGCGSRLIIDEATGHPLPGQEPHQVKEFKKLGEGALADCEFILADPNSKWVEIAGTCEIICTLQTGRRFVPILVQRLTSTDALVTGDASFNDTRRYIRSVIETLEDLGDERDAWVLVRVLNRDEQDTGRVAARALAKIGGQRELDAMNAWLALQQPNNRLVPHVRKARDMLESRLLNQPARCTF